MFSDIQKLQGLKSGPYAKLTPFSVGEALFTSRLWARSADTRLSLSEIAGPVLVKLNILRNKEKFNFKINVIG
jgi:hypothetical protein